MKKGQVIISPRFALRGNVQALVEFYPKGTDGAHGDHASLFLHVYDPATVRYSLRVDDGEYQEIETVFDGHSNDGYHNFCRVKETTRRSALLSTRSRSGVALWYSDFRVA